jgi:hypothetical protein
MISVLGIYIIIGMCYGLYKAITKVTMFEGMDPNKVPVLIFNYFLFILVFSLSVIAWPYSIIKSLIKKHGINEVYDLMKDSYSKHNKLVSISNKDNIIKLVLTCKSEILYWPVMVAGYKIDVHFEGDE